MFYPVENKSSGIFPSFLTAPLTRLAEIVKKIFASVISFVRSFRQERTTHPTSTTPYTQTPSNPSTHVQTPLIKNTTIQQNDAITPPQEESKKDVLQHPGASHSQSSERKKTKRKEIKLKKTKRKETKLKKTKSKETKLKVKKVASESNITSTQPNRVVPGKVPPPLPINNTPRILDPSELQLGQLNTLRRRPLDIAQKGEYKTQLHDLNQHIDWLNQMRQKLEAHETQLGTQQARLTEWEEEKSRLTNICQTLENASDVVIMQFSSKGLDYPVFPSGQGCRTDSPIHHRSDEIVQHALSRITAYEKKIACALQNIHELQMIIEGLQNKLGAALHCSPHQIKTMIKKERDAFESLQRRVNALGRSDSGRKLTRSTSSSSGLKGNQTYLLWRQSKTPPLDEIVAKFSLDTHSESIAIEDANQIPNITENDRVAFAQFERRKRELLGPHGEAIQQIHRLEEQKNAFHTLRQRLRNSKNPVDLTIQIQRTNYTYTVYPDNQWQENYGTIHQCSVIAGGLTQSIRTIKQEIARLKKSFSKETNMLDQLWEQSFPHLSYEVVKQAIAMSTSTTRNPPPPPLKLSKTAPQTKTTDPVRSISSQEVLEIDPSDLIATLTENQNYALIVRGFQKTPKETWKRILGELSLKPRV